MRWTHLPLSSIKPSYLVKELLFIRFLSRSTCFCLYPLNIIEAVRYTVYHDLYGNIIIDIYIYISVYYIYLYISISVLNSIRSWYTDLPSSPNDLSTTSTSPLSAPNKSITCEESLFVRCPGQPKRVRSQRHAEIQIAGVAGAETFLLYIWVWVNTYRYIFSGMNIHKSQLFWGSRMVPGFWPIPIYIYIWEEMEC